MISSPSTTKSICTWFLEYKTNGKYAIHIKDGFIKTKIISLLSIKPLAWGPSGAFRKWIVRPSVIPSHLQTIRTKCNISSFEWWYSYQRWTLVLLSLRWHNMSSGEGSKCRTFRDLHYFYFVATGKSVFHKHMSSFYFDKGILGVNCIFSIS